MFFIKLAVMEGTLIFASIATSFSFDPYATPFFFISPLVALAILYVMQRRDLLSMGAVAPDDLPYVATLPLLLLFAMGILFRRVRFWILATFYPDEIFSILYRANDSLQETALRVLVFVVTGGLYWAACASQFRGTKRQILLLPLLCLGVSSLSLFATTVFAFFVIDPWLG